MNYLEEVSKFSEFFKRFIYLVLERWEGTEKERVRNTDVQEIRPPQLGAWPATQACALTGNHTVDLLVSRPGLNTLSHASQGLSSSLTELKGKNTITK